MSHPDMHVSDGSNKTPLAMSMDAMVGHLAALVSVQQDTQRDIAAQLDILKNFGSPAQRNAATDAQKHVLHGGANPTAGMPNSLTGEGNAGGPIPSQAIPDMGGASYGTPYQSVRAQAATALGQQVLNLNATGRHGAAPAQAGAGGAHAAGGGNPLAGILGGGGGAHAAPGGTGGIRGLAGLAAGGLKGSIQGAAAGYAAQNVAAVGNAIIQSGGSPTALVNNMSQVPMIADTARGAGWFMNQRDRGYRYQEIEGGTNLQGQRERFHEEVYARTTPAWSQGEAREMFQNVRMMGLSRRSVGNTAVTAQEMNNFGYNLKSNLAMTASESSGFGADQLKTATPHLQSLTQALIELSHAAGEAGVNTKMARDMMRGNIQGNLATGMGGYAANTTALGQSLYSTMGNYMTSVSLQGQNTQAMEYRYASQAGMTQGEWKRTQRTDPIGAQRIKDANTKQHLDSQIPPHVRQWIKDEAAAVIEATGELTNTDKDQIARNLMDTHGPGLNTNVIVQIINSQTGVSVDQETWGRFVVDTYLGNTPSKAMEQTKAAPGMVKDGKYVTGPMAGQDAKNPNSGRSIEGLGDNAVQGQVESFFDQGGSGFGAVVNVAKAAPANLGRLAGTAAAAPVQALSDIAHGKIPGSTTWNKLFGEDNEAATKYDEWSKRNGGARETVIDSLLKNVKDPNKQKVQVTVADGKKRIVTLAEAIDKFHNQVVRGDIKFMNEEYRDKSFSEVAGMEGDKTRDASASMNDSEKAKLGQSGEEFKEEQDYGSGKLGRINPFDGKKGLWADTKRFGGWLRGDETKEQKDKMFGKTTVDLTPEAKKLLRLLPGETGSAAADGAPPDPSAAVSDR